ESALRAGAVPDAAAARSIVNLGHVARAGDRNARIAGEPQRYCDLAVGAGFRRHVAMTDHIEPGLLQPLGYRLFCKAEPAVGMFLSQKFELVRRKVDDQQPTLRTQDTRSLAQRARTIVQIVQYLVHDHDVERVMR